MQGHASAEEFDKFECSKMITHGYIYKKTKKFVWTFASYEDKDVSFSDRNIFPVGCIIKMDKDYSLDFSIKSLSLKTLFIYF